MIGRNVIKRMDETTQNYFIAQEALSSDREMLNILQPSGSIECINCDSKLSAEQMNYVAVSTRGRDGHCLGRIGLNAHPTALHVVEPVCSVMCVCFVNETHDHLHCSGRDSFHALLEAGLSCF